MISERSELITLKDECWLTRQKRAGRCVAHILKECEEAIRSQRPNLSLRDLERIALLQMKIHDCTPTFLNYKGFPSAICTSVNKQLVHGVVTDYVLQPGDVVKVDLGATFEGAIADAARTFIYGEPLSEEHVRLVDTCKKSLEIAIENVKVGNRIGAIGNAIHKHVKDSGFGLVTNYGGHGLEYDRPHADPFVSNKADKSEGIRIVPGLTIAIEPLLVCGMDVSTSVGVDKWTVNAKGVAAHFEDTLYVAEDGVHILTEYV